MEDDDDDTSSGAILKIKCLINVTHGDYFIKVEPQWTRKFFGEGAGRERGQGWLAPGPSLIRLVTRAFLKGVLGLRQDHLTPIE